MAIDIPSIITAFIALFIVMDPISSVPVFVTLTKSYKPEKKAEAARIATLVATGVLFGFLFAGSFVLSIMGIRMESFQIAGGIIMLLISISYALGIEFSPNHKHTPVEAVIIGVPLLAGPGVMLTTLLMSSTIGLENVAIAAIGVCLSSYAILVLSSHIYRIIGGKGLEILARVMGVLLAAFAVEYIRRGFGL
ncbi:MarC family integral membrane protein [uncultured archaeon]|nr:MarC family integral membrane protein [uncultured archaeon]